jgi:YVTN family beta-propeller protein
MASIHGRGRGQRSHWVVLTGAALVGIALVALWAISSDDGAQSAPRSASDTARQSVAGVKLYPLPVEVAAACRRFQGDAEVGLLCPTWLPRPSRWLADTATPPGPIDIQPIRGTERSVTGISLSYSAETGDPSQDRPDRFLHFDLQTWSERSELPLGVRRTRLGGEDGLLAPATSRGYVGEPFFANHERFFWRRGTTGYAATLHNFGPGTRAVLGAIVASLRPADDLQTKPDSLSAGVSSIPVPVNGPVAVAVGDEAVWVAGAGTLSRGAKIPAVAQWAAIARLDPDSGEATLGPIEIAHDLGPSALAISDSVWVAHDAVRREQALQQLNPDDGRFTESIVAGPRLTALAIDNADLWAVDLGGWPGDRDYRGGSVERIESDTGRIVATIAVGRAPAGIAIGDGAVWVTNNLDDTVSRIDPGSNQVVETIKVGRGPTGVAAGYDGVWVVNHDGDTLSRIDPEAHRVVETIAVGDAPRSVAAGEGGVWVSNSLDDTVSRLDPETARITETIRVPSGPAGIATGAGAIWVASTLDRAIARIDP